MSALGKKQTSDCRPLMSALPPKADIAERDYHVRFVPQADIPAASRRTVTGPALLALRHAVH
jgi:hypothetical protein